MISSNENLSDRDDIFKFFDRLQHTAQTILNLSYEPKVFSNLKNLWKYIIILPK